MARILWFSWCGGGNLPPSLGIAQALERRGHSVTFAGRREMKPRVQEAGFATIELTEAYSQIDRYPHDSPVQNMICYLTSPAVEAEVSHVALHFNPDLILIDAKFVAALTATMKSRCPTAVVCHTFFYRMFDTWRDHLHKLIELRQQAGFSALPGIDELWLARKAILSTSLAQLDRPTEKQEQLRGLSIVHHVGPIFYDTNRQSVEDVPWSLSDTSPQVLLSFSTQPEQTYLSNFQKSLDALGGLSVRTIGTTAEAIKIEALRIPPNAFIAPYLDHNSIMRRAALVVSHGGHGTAMRSLKHGIPMVLLPGIAPDQPIVAAACEEWGVGRVVPETASVEDLRSAISEVLNDRRYHAAATNLMQEFGETGGSIKAALLVEALISR